MAEDPLIGRRVATVSEIKLPGDYAGPFPHNDDQAVYFLKPNARDPDVPPIARSMQWIKIPPHTIRECEDGSLEVRASIGDTRAGGDPAIEQSDGWHGWLNEGHVWTTAGPS